MSGLVFIPSTAEGNNQLRHIQYHSLITGKEMHSSSPPLDEEGCNTKSFVSDWHYWCRLCAKCGINDSNVFMFAGKTGDDNDYTMSNAIAKYFCVQIKHDDDLPKLLCTECNSLLSTVIQFNERIAKVQEMYSALQSGKYNPDVDNYTIRLKYGVLKEDPIYEEKYCIEKVDHAIAVEIPNFEDKLKEETSSGRLQADEFTYEFDNERVAGEDPFASDFEVEPPKKKVLKTKRNKSSQSSNKKSNDSSKNSLQDCQDEPLDTKYFCDKCSLHFQRLGNYRMHMKKRHGMTSEPLICPQCAKSFKNAFNLNRHIKKHRPLSEKRIYPCPQCDRKYQTKDYVARHIQFVHEDIRPFICEECGEGSRTESALREHMLTHTDYAPFECGTCKKGFKNETRLKNHMEIHSSTKHTCSECGLQLNSRVTLNRHMLVHSDVMRHKCDFCGRRFKRAKTLKTHLILHSGLKPYSCEFCDKTFTNGSNCRTHMKRAHPNELAAAEALGEKTYTKNIPNLAVLKAVTQSNDNLIPVVSKSSGNFSLGRKPKLQLDSTIGAKGSNSTTAVNTAMEFSNQAISKEDSSGNRNILDRKDKPSLW